MQNVHKKIETAANIAIIAVALLLGGILVNRYFFNPAPNAPPSEDNNIKVGMKLPLSNVDWTKSEKSLVMVLSTTCHFCNESTPFYQKLTKLKAENPKVRVIAVMPQSADEAQKYLAEHNISVDEVKPIKSEEMFVRGTPTLILVDRNGAATESWVGKLSADKETEVLSHL